MDQNKRAFQRITRVSVQFRSNDPRATEQMTFIPRWKGTMVAIRLTFLSPSRISEIRTSAASLFLLLVPQFGALMQVSVRTCRPTFNHVNQIVCVKQTVGLKPFLALVLVFNPALAFFLHLACEHVRALLHSTRMPFQGVSVGGRIRCRSHTPQCGVASSLHPRDLGGGLDSELFPSTDFRAVFDSEGDHLRTISDWLEWSLSSESRVERCDQEITRLEAYMEDEWVQQSAALRISREAMVKCISDLRESESYVQSK